MAKEKFNWKALFINEEEGSNTAKNTPAAPKPTVTTTTTSSFPKTSAPVSKFPNSIPTAPPVNLGAAVSNSVLNTIIEMYESGFESLNKPGYDFYEFFKAIKAVGSNDPSAYKMALVMAQSADPKMNKSTLLNEADFYIKEIEKVHQQYSVQGNKKRSLILETQNSKKSSLDTQIKDLERRLLEMQNQISEKRNQLQSMDSEIINDISEIDQKIMANDKARNKILETIGTVVNGIKNNV